MTENERILEETRYLLTLNERIVPINNNLRHFAGFFEVHKNNKLITIPYEIRIPERFPYEPPKIRFLFPFHHSIIKDGVLEIPLLRDWKSHYHVFQVINAIRGHFHISLPTFNSITNKTEVESNKEEVVALIEQIAKMEEAMEGLREKLKEKTEPEKPSLPHRLDLRYEDKLKGFVIDFLHIIEHERPLLTIGTFFHEFRKYYNDFDTTIDSIIKILDELAEKKIISSIVELKDKIKIIQIKPGFLSTDINTILDLAKDVPYLTKNDIIKKIGWDAYRASQALNTLEELGLAKKISSHSEGERWYIVN